MDRRAFDQFTRSFARPSTRRTTVAALLAVALGGSAVESMAKGHRRGKSRRRAANQVSAAAASCDNPGPDTNLNFCDFTGANLAGADLSDSDMIQTTFLEANLARANLHDVVARRANFSVADLCGADLEDANLRNANFTEAVLFKASLDDSQCAGANFGNAKFCRTTLCNGNVSNRDCPDGVDPDEICCIDRDCATGRLCVDHGCCTDIGGPCTLDTRETCCSKECRGTRCCIPNGQPCSNAGDSNHCCSGVCVCDDTCRCA
jgi:hypothetical protein